VSETTAVLDWGNGWAPVEPAIELQAELMAELGKTHPLKDMNPRVVGRCLACDDVVATLADGPDVAVVHLTWQGRAEARRSDGRRPYFERMTTEEFTRRFLREGEHM
jgi:hypothetical protein